MLALVAMMCCNTDLSAQGLFKRIGEAVKRTAENVVESKAVQKTTDVIEGAIDGAKKGAKKDTDDEPEVTTSGKPAEDVTAEAAGEQKKSDFVPGAVTLFEDKITGEQVGEFPSKWNLIEGNCEVSKLGGETVISLPPATTQDEYVDSQIQPLMKNIFNY